MAPTLLLFVLALMLVVFANLGQLNSRARWLTYTILAVLASLTLMGGLALQFLELPLPDDLLPEGVDPTAPGLAIWLIISGLVAILFIAAAIVSTLQKRDPHIGRLYWSRPVQLAAAVLAVIYAGNNLALAAAIVDPAALLQGVDGVSTIDLLAQTLGFLAIAFLGVGLGIRRDWSQTIQRLGITPLRASHLGIAAGIAMAMVFASAVAGGILTLLFPESLGDVEALNQVLTQSFQSPMGAITLGLMTGIGEEFLYRGALQPVFGIWVTSIIFAIHHLQYLNPAFLLIFLLGFVLGLIRLRWGTTTAAITHGIYNATLILISLAATQVVQP